MKGLTACLLFGTGGLDLRDQEHLFSVRQIEGRMMRLLCLLIGLCRPPPIKEPLVDLLPLKSSSLFHLLPYFDIKRLARSLIDGRQDVNMCFRHLVPSILDPAALVAQHL